MYRICPTPNQPLDPELRATLPDYKDLECLTLVLFRLDGLLKDHPNVAWFIIDQDTDDIIGHFHLQ